MNKTKQISIAKQALKEAQLRHKQNLENKEMPQKEIGGRKGPDPTRYGDWEKKGIISDF